SCALAFRHRRRQTRSSPGAGRGEAESMRLPRFRLRTLMIVVAVAAVATGAEGMRRRHTAFRSIAQLHARHGVLHREVAATFQAGVETDQEIASFFREAVERESGNKLHREIRDRTEKLVATEKINAERYAKLAAYHARLRAKYERAARYPFLPVPPDPPM